MAVAPLNKTKIIKKQRRHPNRFKSDQWLRVKVCLFAQLVLINTLCRNRGANLAVLTTGLDEGTVET